MLELPGVRVIVFGGMSFVLGNDRVTFLDWPGPAMPTAALLLAKQAAPVESRIVAYASQLLPS